MMLYIKPVQLSNLDDGVQSVQASLCRTSDLSAQRRFGTDETYPTEDVVSHRSFHETEYMSYPAAYC